MELASGQPYTDFVIERILVPLSLTATGYGSSMFTGTFAGHAA